MKTKRLIHQEPATQMTTLWVNELEVTVDTRIITGKTLDIRMISDDPDTVGLQTRAIMTNTPISLQTFTLHPVQNLLRQRDGCDKQIMT